MGIAPYVGSQFHAQDEFGNLNYGYSNLNSAKAEAGNTYGGVHGGYSYVDANGVLQQVQYVADAAGFRVAERKKREAEPAFAYGFATHHPYAYSAYHPYAGLGYCCRCRCSCPAPPCCCCRCCCRCC